MNYSFKTLWNATFIAIGPVWCMLAWMIWSSGQLKTPAHQATFLGVLIPGFILIYASGFLIQKRHAGKQLAKRS